MLITVGDVTGHGGASAMVTAAAVGACDAFVRRAGTALNLAGLMLALDAAVRRVGGGALSMTCTAAIIDPRSGELAFASCGHTVPYLVRSAEREGGIVRSAEREGGIVRSAEREGGIVRSAEREGGIVRSAEREGGIVRSAEREGGNVRSAEREGGIVRSAEREGGIVRSGKREGGGVSSMPSSPAATCSNRRAAGGQGTKDDPAG